jgi:DNA-binding XRE family transcriptional regulator
MKTTPKSRKKPLPKLDSLFLSAEESAKISLRRLGKAGEREFVCANLFDLRIKAGFTQRELAEKAKMGFRTLQRVEVDPNYSPSLDILVRLGNALGVPAERFLKKADFKKIYGF